MDRPQRDIVFCHQCENEWFRDESGLTCPDCQSDFTEIVEGGNDPRAQQGEDHHDALPGHNHNQPPLFLPNSADRHPLQDHDPWNAPDPDEDDIDHFQWQRQAPGQFHASFNRTYNLDGRERAQQGQGGGAAGGGLLGLIGNMVGGLLPQPGQQGQGHDHENPRGRGQELGTDDQTRALSAPGSGNAGEQPQGRPGTYTRHVHGPGYSFTMTATTSNNLSPRNANNPQPFNAQPQDISDLMQQVLNNVGGFAPPSMPGQDPRHNQQPRGPGGNPVFPPTLLQLLNNLAIPGNGVQGDAVYSQEALDRIMSGLMEQHTASNAPGPASDAAINSLPTRPITDKDAGDSGSADCSICMDTVPTGGVVKVLPCSHWFHDECIHAWLGAHDTCPVCRKGIMPREPAAEGEGARTSSQAPLNDQSAPAAAAAPGAAGAATAGANGSSSAGVFSRMRDAFGGGGRGGPGATGGTGDSST